MKCPISPERYALLAGSENVVEKILEKQEPDNKGIFFAICKETYKDGVYNPGEVIQSKCAEKTQENKRFQSLKASVCRANSEANSGARVMKGILQDTMPYKESKQILRYNLEGFGEEYFIEAKTTDDGDFVCWNDMLCNRPPSEDVIKVHFVSSAGECRSRCEKDKECRSFYFSFTGDEPHCRHSVTTITTTADTAEVSNSKDIQCGQKVVNDDLCSRIDAKGNSIISNRRCFECHLLNTNEENKKMFDCPIGNKTETVEGKHQHLSVCDVRFDDTSGNKIIGFWKVALPMQINSNTQRSENLKQNGNVEYFSKVGTEGSTSFIQVGSTDGIREVKEGKVNYYEGQIDKCLLTKMRYSEIRKNAEKIQGLKCWEEFPPKFPFVNNRAAKLGKYFKACLEEDEGQTLVALCAKLPINFNQQKAILDLYQAYVIEQSARRKEITPCLPQPYLHDEYRKAGGVFDNAITSQPFGNDEALFHGTTKVATGRVFMCEKKSFLSSSIRCDGTNNQGKFARMNILKIPQTEEEAAMGDGKAAGRLTLLLGAIDNLVDIVNGISNEAGWLYSIPDAIGVVDEWSRLSKSSEIVAYYGGILCSKIKGRKNKCVEWYMTPFLDAPAGKYNINIVQFENTIKQWERGLKSTYAKTNGPVKLPADTGYELHIRPLLASSDATPQAATTQAATTTTTQAATTTTTTTEATEKTKEAYYYMFDKQYAHNIYAKGNLKLCDAAVPGVPN